VAEMTKLKMAENASTLNLTKYFSPKTFLETGGSRDRWEQRQVGAKMQKSLSWKYQHKPKKDKTAQQCNSSMTYIATGQN